jgi:hypothetical protein
LSAETIRNWIETGNYFVIALASIVGGAWAYLRFCRERRDQAALGMEPFSVSLEPLEELHLATFQVTLKNAGRTRIMARPRKIGPLAYDDGVETLAHYCCLQLRRIERPPASPRTIDWFDSTVAHRVEGIEDINLLAAYENPKDNAIEFWMEPHESYVLSANCVLHSGHYIAKATFIAAGDDGNFWTRIMQFTVPSLGNEAAIS